jgi:hypothetical protein
VEKYFVPNAVVYLALGLLVSENEYSTQKYIFVTWVGTKVKPLHRARSSQHRVSLYNFFNRIIPFAGELQAQTPEEITKDIVKVKLTGSRVHEEGDKIGTKVETTSAPSSRKKAGTSQFDWDNEEEARAVLVDLRNDNTKTSWVVFGHKADERDTLLVLAKGEGDLSEMKQYFKDSDVVYAVYRVIVKDKSTDGDEDYDARKNIFISWVGPTVKPLQKARSSQHRLALYNYIKPHLQLHGELQALNIADVNENVVTEKLTGTRN